MATLRAALPMYDYPPLAVAHQALLTAVVTHLHRHGHAHLPSTLSRPSPLLEFWQSQRVLLSQTCEYPWLLSLQNHLEILATPCYAAPHCEGPLYRSVVVTRSADPRSELADFYNARVTINDLTSNSGYNLLGAAVADLKAKNPFFKAALISGSHHNSLNAIRANAADVAAIDCVSFAQLARCALIDPDDFKIIGVTPPAGALPWVCSKNLPDPLKADLVSALSQILRDDRLTHTRQALLLNDFNFTPDRTVSLTRAASQRALNVILCASLA